MTDDLDLLQARLDALKAAKRARNGELPMYEHGRPVKAEEPIPYRITPLGRMLVSEAYERLTAGDPAMVRKFGRLFPGMFPSPIHDEAPGAGDEPPCKTDPRAPHGFLRQASHSADRYVCECEFWRPEDDIGWDANGSPVEGVR